MTGDDGGGEGDEDLRRRWREITNSVVTGGVITDAVITDAVITDSDAM